jgi:hypothetical protein
LVEETGENHWPVTNMEKADVCPQKNTFTCNYKHDSFTLPYFCVSNQDLDIHRKMLWHFCVQWFEWQWIMVFNATFNNISVILWWSVLLMEETGVPWQTWSHNVVLRTCTPCQGQFSSILLS